MASALNSFLQSSDHWDKLPFLHSTFIFIHLLLSLICSILVSGQTEDEECTLNSLLCISGSFSGPWREWKPSQRYYDSLCFPETLWTALFDPMPFCSSRFWGWRKPPVQRVSWRAGAVLLRSPSAIEIQPLFHNLFSLSCRSYCGIIYFSLPLSVSPAEKWPGVTMSPLFSFEFGVKRQERSRGLWTAPGSPPEVRAGLCFARVIFIFLGHRSNLGGFCKELLSWRCGMQRDGCALPVEETQCVSIRLCKRSALRRLCWSRINCAKGERALKNSSRQSLYVEVCSISLNCGCRRKKPPLNWKVWVLLCCLGILESWITSLVPKGCIY